MSLSSILRRHSILIAVLVFVNTTPQEAMCQTTEEYYETREILNKAKKRIVEVRQERNQQMETIASLTAGVEERIGRLVARTGGDVGIVETTRRLVAQVTPRVVVIEGDQGSGTGFLCKEGGVVWVYTAAHVISGNNTITVRDHQGRGYQEFEFMECAEGFDLVRLKLKNQELDGLELSAATEAPELGGSIVAIGNSLGAGALSGESGRVIGRDQDMWQVSAGVIPGNSGGPVLATHSGKVVGIVTHLIISRPGGGRASADDLHIQRYAARLDRPHEWRRMQVSRFVNEWKHIDRMYEETCIAWASANMIVEHIHRHFDPTAQRLPRVPQEAREITSAQPDHIHVRRAQSWMREMDRANRTSQKHAIDRADVVIKQILDDIRPKTTDPKDSDFSWYHRQTYESLREWRVTLTKIEDDK